MALNLCCRLENAANVANPEKKEPGIFKQKEFNIENHFK